MQTVVHYIAVFFLLLFSLNSVSVCLFSGKQTSAVVAATEDLPESYKKNCEEKEPQCESAMYQRPGVSALIPAALRITANHRNAYLQSYLLTAVPTPPPEIA